MNDQLAALKHATSAQIQAAAGTRRRIAHGSGSGSRLSVVIARLRSVFV